ncbi:unnamed protein product [Heterobilharzia americana]|nr:unnamed protein product [Heterobilharzia americana]
MEVKDDRFIVCGDCSDSFEVNAGDLQGSTVGYCFITYKSVDDAKKAWKALDGLDFHGYTLVARPARPTRDELTVAQRASDEATKLRIIEEAKQREAQLATVMGVCDSTIITSGHVEKCLDRATCDEHPIHPPKMSVGDTFPNSSSMLSSHIFIPDLYGKLGLHQNCKANSQGPNFKTPLLNSSHRLKHQAKAKVAIHKIEMALRKLERTPVGGAASLKPITDGHNPYTGKLILKSTNIGKSNPNDQECCSMSSLSRSFGGIRGKSLVGHDKRRLDAAKHPGILSTVHCARSNRQLTQKYAHKRDFISQHF